MFGVLVRLFALAATQALVAITVIGLGLGVRRLFGTPTTSVRDLLVAFWVGLAVAFLLTLVWNFGFPVNGIPLTLVAAGGAAGLLASRRALKTIASEETWWRSPAVVAGALLLWLWIANQARGPITNWDSGLYHLQGVAWAEQHKVVPGLANLFGPLGFNNGSLLWDALLDGGPLRGRGSHLANAIPIQMLALLGLAGLARARKVSGAARSQALFDAVCLVPAITWALEDWVTSFATDVPTGGAVLLAAVELHALLLDADEPSPGAAARRGYRLVTIGTLLTLAVCFKVSSAVFAATGLGLALGAFLVRPASPPLRRKALAWLAGAVLVVGGTWVGRGIVLSGYPLFPGSWLPFPVEWRVPSDHAAGEFAFAANSSKASTENAAVIVDGAGVPAWFPDWWTDSAMAEIFLMVVPAAFAVAAGLVWFVRRARRGGPDPTPQCWWLLAPLAASILVWFFVAPEPRYASPLFWATMATCWVGVVRMAPPEQANQAARALGLGVLLLTLSQPLLDPLLSTSRAEAGESILTRVVRRNLRYPDDKAWPSPKIHSSAVRQYQTDGGLTLTVPADRCWSRPLPCTPNPAKNLRLRVPGRLDGGFVIDGPWRMENWPANRPEFARLWFLHTHRDSANTSR